MIADPKVFIESAIRELKESQNFAEDYVYFKMMFFREFQNGLVFSTRFGADFFDEVKVFMDNPRLRLKPVDGQTELGECDKNFNKWLDCFK